MEWTIGTGAASRSTRGFTGHEMDDRLGLINMNARIYDPLLARFLSPDDVLPDPTNLQAYNRYSYVINNPLAFTDPTGHIATGGSSELGDAADDGAAGAEVNDKETTITTHAIFDGDNFTHGWGVVATELGDPFDPDSEDRDIYGHTNHGPDDDVPDSGTDNGDVNDESGVSTGDPGGGTGGGNVDPNTGDEDDRTIGQQIVDAGLLGLEIAAMVHPGARAVSLGIKGVKAATKAMKAANKWGLRQRTSASPPNLSPPGAGRRGALREAKRNNDVRNSKQPDDVTEVFDNTTGKRQGREYGYTNERGDKVTISEHGRGHNYGPGNSQNRGSHFNDQLGNHYDY